MGKTRSKRTCEPSKLVTYSLSLIRVNPWKAVADVRVNPLLTR